MLVEGDARLFQKRNCYTVSKTPERQFSKIKLLCLNKKTPARMFLFHRNGKTNGSSLGGHCNDISSIFANFILFSLKRKSIGNEFEF